MFSILCWSCSASFDCTEKNTTNEVANFFIALRPKLQARRARFDFLSEMSQNKRWLQAQQDSPDAGNISAKDQGKLSSWFAARSPADHTRKSTMREGERLPSSARAHIQRLEQERLEQTHLQEPTQGLRQNRVQDWFDGGETTTGRNKKRNRGQSLNKKKKFDRMRRFRKEKAKEQAVADTPMRSIEQVHHGIGVPPCEALYHVVSIQSCDRFCDHASFSRKPAGMPRSI